MRMTRWRGWGIDLFLWVCPLVGVGVFFGSVVAGKVPPQNIDLRDASYFNVPGSARLALLGGALLVPLILSLFTRRWLGFLAGASLLLLLAAGAAWVRSHQATDRILFARVMGAVPQPRVHAALFASAAGGWALELYRSEDPRLVEGVRKDQLGGTREQALWYSASGPQERYPSLYGDFMTTPERIQRMGFAVAVNPTQKQRVDEAEIPFALALPYWFLCLLAIPFPLAWTIRLRRRRRFAQRARLGLCRACGYDLRATPDATGALLAICPECGAAGKAESVRTGTQELA